MLSESAKIPVVDRAIDVSLAAARELGMQRRGVAKVRVEAFQEDQSRCCCALRPKTHANKARGMVRIGRINLLLQQLLTRRPRGGVTLAYRGG